MYFRSLIVSTLEKVLNMLLTQIILCDRLTNFSSRDKKMFKRELSSEIVRKCFLYYRYLVLRLIKYNLYLKNTILHGLSRTFKRSTSMQYPSKSPTAGGSSSASGTGGAGQAITTSSSSNLQAASSLLNSSSKQTYDFFKCIYNVLQSNIVQ